MRTLAAAARRLKPAFDRRGRPLPRLWLLGDPERLPDPRCAAARLPPGSAVIARGQAPAILVGLARIARQRRLTLLIAGDGRAAVRLHAGLHVPDRRPTRTLLPFLLARRTGRAGLLCVAAHGGRGLARAARLDADLVLLSPAFATTSHPGQQPLGPSRWAALARWARRPAVALGGVTAATAPRLARRDGAPAGLAAVGGLA